ncbi:MAG: HlyD family type I secretion periplasmic adaptor subunit [Hoeflea sp.]|uniref:HlyD family type I secretion periplasmic adaptor subunit n=1 Tax=Hoeflea sp. TaxID=1940281 RepID=UPI00329A32A6
MNRMTDFPGDRPSNPLPVSLAALKEKPAPYPKPTWQSRVPTSTRGLMGLTGIILVLFLGGFSYWAAFAPLTSAVIASGVVAASGRNIPVQHLEGGIVEEIMVSEGDQVAQGQVLYRMNTVATSALRNRLAKQILDAELRELRLKAERDDAETLNVPEDLRRRAEEEGLLELANEQVREFNIRLERYLSETLILKQRVQIQEEAIAGLMAEKSSLDIRIELLSDELKDKRGLLAQGLTNRSDVNRLAQDEAELIGQAGMIDSQITVARSKIIEAREQVSFARTQRLETAITELAELRRVKEDLTEQFRASQDTLARGIVTAPEDGVVLEVRVNNTPGSVVEPAAVLLVLLPTSKSLLVDARVSPGDIDSVHLAQEARLRFVTAGNGETPAVEANVAYISADKFIDATTNTSFYAVRLAVPEELPEEMKATGVLPGMPVEVFIETGERTFLQYLMRRLVDSTQRAFLQE